MIIVVATKIGRCIERPNVSERRDDPDDGGKWKREDRHGHAVVSDGSKSLREARDKIYLLGGW